MLSVADVMTAPVDTIHPEATLREALGTMNRDGCRHLPVIDAGRLVGILTERDVRLATNSPVIDGELNTDRAALLDSVLVRTCMSAEPVCVTPQTPAAKAADTLQVYRLGALPVVESGELVGIVSTTDFLRYCAEHLPSRET